VVDPGTVTAGPPAAPAPVRARPRPRVGGPRALFRHLSGHGGNQRRQCHLEAASDWTMPPGGTTGGQQRTGADSLPGLGA
jgi:hypothetical protein